MEPIWAKVFSVPTNRIDTPIATLQETLVEAQKRYVSSLTVIPQLID